MLANSLHSKDMSSITVLKQCLLSQFCAKGISYHQRNSPLSKHLLKLVFNKVKESCSCNLNMERSSLLDKWKLGSFVVPRLTIKTECILKLLHWQLLRNKEQSTPRKTLLSISLRIYINTVLWLKFNKMNQLFFNWKQIQYVLKLNFKRIYSSLVIATSRKRNNKFSLFKIKAIYPKHKFHSTKSLISLSFLILSA